MVYSMWAGSLKEKRWGKCQGRGGMCVSLINLSVMIKTGNCWQSQREGAEGKLFEDGLSYRNVCGPKKFVCG